MSNRLVIFTSNNARILINPEDFEELKTKPNVVVNPVLTHLKGIPPHLWKLQDGQIFAMSELEQVARLKHLSKHPADVNIRMVVNNKSKAGIYWATLSLLTGIAAIALYWVTHRA